MPKLDPQALGGLAVQKNFLKRFGYLKNDFDIQSWVEPRFLNEALASLDAQPLQAVALPEIGGDTIWASTEAAYDRLAEPLKRLAESLTAVHATTPLRATEWGGTRGFGGEFIWSEHPVVTVHPETGRKSLFVSPRYTPEIVGLRPHESAAVLKVFFDHITQPEHQVRFQWTVGAIALWDNRSALHYAVDDYDDALRIVHSIGVQGEPRVGPAGERSKFGASVKSAPAVAK